MIDLTGLTPAAEQGWLVLFDLAAETTDDWLLVGGLMMLLLAAEGEAVLPRSTNELDVVVDVRSRPDGTQRLAHWLQRRDFELEGASTDGIGHRFVRWRTRVRGGWLSTSWPPRGWDRVRPR